MPEAYMVVTGVYDERQVVHVFGQQETAEAWALRYNGTYSWDTEHDSARVEPVPFTPAGANPPAP